MKWNRIIFKFVSISFSILVTLLVIVGLTRLGTFCYDFGYRVFTEAPVDAKPGRDVVVAVSSDMSELEIGRMLEEEGLVRDGMLFYAQLKLSAYSGDLQSGVYTLNTSMTGKDMIVVMASSSEENSLDEESGADSIPADEDVGIEPETAAAEPDEGWKGDTP